MLRPLKKKILGLFFDLNDYDILEEGDTFNKNYLIKKKGELLSRINVEFSLSGSAPKVKREIIKKDPLGNQLLKDKEEKINKALEKLVIKK